MTKPLNKTSLLKGLLQYNYFPRQHDNKEEIPPIFNSVKFTPEIAKKLNALGVRKGAMGYDVLPFRRTRHPNIPRMMGIPHPRAYARLVYDIADQWSRYISKCCQSPNSETEFAVQEDFRIIVHKYGHVAPDGDIEPQNPMFDFGKKYRVKTDITNFYHSIYSHSLPWALVGHKKAKKYKGPKHKNKWFNKVDDSVMLSQRRETKGICIGPATSNILSEIILFRIDEKLQEEKFLFKRYIDDYTAYVESHSEADRFLMVLTRELEKFSLSLNPRKTYISKLPVSNRESWLIDINLFFGTDEGEENEKTGNKIRPKLKFRQLKLIIDKAVSLSREYPDGSVIKYAFAAIIDIGVDGDDAKLYFRNCFLKYAYYYPTLIPLIQRWIGKSFLYDDDLDDRLFSLLDRSFEQGQSDNIVWCIYYLLRIDTFINANLLKRCCEKDDPMVILMGYVYAKKEKLPLDAIINWADEKIQNYKKKQLNEYDIDRFWLVFYQLYFDGVMKRPPYKEKVDKEVFQELKKGNVSFIDFDHDDLVTPLDKVKKLFANSQPNFSKKKKKKNS